MRGRPCSRAVTKARVSFVALVAGAAFSWSRSGAASQAPSPAVTPESESPSPSESSVPPLRVGVIGGIGFPHPLAIEGMAELSGYVALGVEYGGLPTVTIDNVATNLWSLAADVRVFPFRGAFFIGLLAGRQHVGATTSISVASLGSATEVLALDSWFLNPRIGFLFTSREGLSLGFEAGVQFPLSPTTSSTLPLSLYPSAQRTIEVLGSTAIPTVDLLRIGLLL